MVKLWYHVVGNVTLLKCARRRGKTSTMGQEYLNGRVYRTCNMLEVHKISLAVSSLFLDTVTS